MARFLQLERPLQVTTDLGPDKFLLASIQGEEALSRPFVFRLDLRSEDAAIAGADLLRTPVTVMILTDLGMPPRYIHGLISRFVQLGKNEELTAYYAEIVPWLWFLSLYRDCRIFQEMSVLDIVQEVFDGRGFSDYRVACTKSYGKREYCVQFRETDLDFVSRLLEEEGIFYFYEHSDGKHVLVLADDNNSVPTGASMPRARIVSEGAARQDVITSFSCEDAVHTGKVTLRDYDPLQPTLSLEGTISGVGDEEAYEYPGRFTVKDDGDRLVRLRLEAEEAVQETVRGRSTCRGLQAGTTFDLENHYRAELNQEYLIVEASIAASTGSVRGGEGETFDYHNEFLAIPSKVPYRPPHRTPRPVIAGSQTAVVVGKPGEEVWVDKYGRVKVQFHWDRLGPMDDTSSCWVRVITPWGGKGYGSVSIPRIGNEVIVTFLDGDPDRPVITGSVYNAEQMPPYALPGSGIQMGMKSRSSPGGGGTNEITMTDTKGKEIINIHAQYDMTTTVEHDSTTTVNNNMTTTVKVDDTQSVKGNRTIDVTGTQSEHVKGAVAESYDTKQDTTVKGDITIKSTSGSIAILADGQHVFIQGTDNIQLHVGSSMIWMDSGGQINIKGVDVAINGSNSVTIKGLNITSQADAQNSTKGALVISEGSATNTVKGGMVMLNP